MRRKKNLGRPPAARRSLHTRFLRAIAASPYPLVQIRTWLKADGERYDEIMGGKPFPVTEQKLDVVRALAERIGYRGPLFVPDRTEAQTGYRMRRLQQMLKGGR